MPLVFFDRKGDDPVNNLIVCIVMYVVLMVWVFASATVQVSAVRPLGEFESPTYLPHHRAFAHEIEETNP